MVANTPELVIFGGPKRSFRARVQLTQNVCSTAYEFSLQGWEWVVHLPELQRKRRDEVLLWAAGVGRSEKETATDKKVL